ncbi:L-tyrosine 3-hydroxylase [Streptomyces sp. NPDC020141]|uniref:L-tyrosine 3-hydroxylase n=1 Tax=Streptomyces sp. NPDC020141 TaxID=3365065 RepID=UPI0037A874D5
MSLSDTAALSASPPRSARWEFGGHLYGLEPLALPPTRLPRPAGHAPGPLPERLVPHPPGRAVDGLPPTSESEVERLFWFRWITGHQTTFILWQLLAAVLDEARRPGADPDALARGARALVRGYSLMLLYSGSPPRPLYERVIRGPIARMHPNLSGSWARDYAGVRPLIRGKTRLGGEREAAALAAECELNERVHRGIAARLVPSGVSLLLDGEVRRGERPLGRDTLRWLYDGIFLTTRAAVSHEAVTGQLLRRLHAILLDLSANGLHPACAPSAEQEPPDLLGDDVLALTAAFPETLLGLAAIAGPPGAGQPLAGASPR